MGKAAQPCSELRGLGRRVVDDDQAGSGPFRPAAAGAEDVEIVPPGEAGGPVLRPRPGRQLRREPGLAAPATTDHRLDRDPARPHEPGPEPCERLLAALEGQALAVVRREHPQDAAPARREARLTRLHLHPRRARIVRPAVARQAEPDRARDRHRIPVAQNLDDHGAWALGLRGLGHGVRPQSET